MLTCNACMKRCLQTIIGDAAPSTFPFLSNSKQVRSFNNLAASDLVPWTNLSRQEGSSRRNPVKDSKSAYKHLTREEWIASRGVRPANRPANRPATRSKSISDFGVEKHIRYLQDPLKLADFIRETLMDDEFEKAEQFVRAASKTIQCTVSWNHLVEWQLSKGKMNAAIKTYNEVCSWTNDKAVL